MSHDHEEQAYQSASDHIKGELFGWIDNPQEVVSHLIGMSSARWGNGFTSDHKAFKLWHSSPQHKGDKPSIGFCSAESFKTACELAGDNLHPFYKTLIDIQK